MAAWVCLFCKVKKNVYDDLFPAKLNFFVMVARKITPISSAFLKDFVHGSVTFFALVALMYVFREGKIWRAHSFLTIGDYRSREGRMLNQWLPCSPLYKRGFPHEAISSPSQPWKTSHERRGFSTRVFWGPVAFQKMHSAFLPSASGPIQDPGRWILTVTPDSVVKAACILCNCLCKDVADQASQDDSCGDAASNNCLQAIPRPRGNQASAEALQSRNTFKDYFVSPAGHVQWQYDRVCHVCIPNP